MKQLDEREVVLVDLYLRVLLAEMEEHTEALEEDHDQVVCSAASSFSEPF